MYTNAPTLLSENLILRGPEARDQEPVIAFLQDEDRAARFGALPNRGDAWRWFALNVGHWAMHGYGYFLIETAKTAGISGIWNPEGWPEPEVGWVVFDGFEAASLMRLRIACAGPMKIWDLKQSQAISFRATSVPSVWPNAWAPLRAHLSKYTYGRGHVVRHPSPPRWCHDQKHRRDTDDYTDAIPTFKIGGNPNMSDAVNRAAEVLKEHRESIDRLDAILVYTLGERFKHTQAVEQAEHDLPLRTQHVRQADCAPRELADQAKLRP